MSLLGIGAPEMAIIAIVALLVFGPGKLPEVMGQVGRAIRTRRWKYSVYAPEKRGGKDPDSDRYVEQYLYDLANDPHERDNLVKDTRYAGVREDLRQKLKRRIVEAGEREPIIEAARD